MTPQSLINIDGAIRDVAFLTIPAKRDFREAWQLSGRVVEHDLEKAKEIHKNRLRAERAIRMETLDTRFMKALETEDSEARQQVIAEKQALRDMPTNPLWDMVTSVEDLRKITLDRLCA